MSLISTREATIKTVGVAIRSLTVSSKQVTMGLFRQLELEPLVDAATGALNGVPWGRVNYFWGDCRNDHLHVVWQKGEELRRACCWQVRISELTLKDLREELSQYQKTGRDHHYRTPSGPESIIAHSSYLHDDCERRLGVDPRLLDPEIIALLINNDPEEHERLEGLWAKRWQELCDLPQLFIAVCGQPYDAESP
jgi:hypothetical protein